MVNVPTYPPVRQPSVWNAWMNSMEDFKNGFTPEGTFKSPYTYLIVRNGSDYQLCNAYQVLDTDTDFEALIDSIITSNITIVLDGSGGNFEVPSQSGIWWAASTGHADLENVTLAGVNKARFLYTYTGGAALSLFYIADGWKDFCARDIIFDMNYIDSGVVPIYPDTTSDTGVQDQASLGTAWNVAVGTHIAETTVENVIFDHCQFLHSAGSTLNIATANHVYFNDCVLDGAAEHIMYVGQGSKAENNVDLQFNRCKFYNWAKQWRGYFKITLTDYFKMTGCYSEPNKDGLGAGALRNGEKGQYGPVIAACNHTRILNSDFIGDGSAHMSYVIDVENSVDTTIKNIAVKDWYYLWFPAGSTYTKLVDSYIKDTGFDGYPDIMENVKVETDGSVVTLNVGLTPGVYAHTEAEEISYHLSDYNSGSLHSNLGAGGVIELWLEDSPTAGDTYIIFVAAAQIIRLKFEGENDAFYYNGSKQSDEDYLYSNTIGSSVTVVADENGDWYVTNVAGTWATASP